MLVLIAVGFHAPETPLVDVVGKDGAIAPKQNGPIALNVGVVTGFTTMVAALAKTCAHPPAIWASVTVTVVLAVKTAVVTTTVPVAPVLVIKLAPPRLYVTVAEGVPVNVNCAV
jgi:uncharacterized protein (DUF983 family)